MVCGNSRAIRANLDLTAQVFPTLVDVPKVLVVLAVLAVAYYAAGRGGGLSHRQAASDLSDRVWAVLGWAVVAMCVIPMVLVALIALGWLVGLAI